MTAFQIVSLCIAIATLLGAMIAVYVKLLSSIANVGAKCDIEVAKINAEIASINRESRVREVALLLNEKNNREDHKEIMAKIDQLLKKT